jgi:hypothetical protein
MVVGGGTAARQPPPLTPRLGAHVGTGMFLFATSSWPTLDPTQFLYQSRLLVR